jgi:hypothetical protein
MKSPRTFISASLGTASANVCDCPLGRPLS